MAWHLRRGVAGVTLPRRLTAETIAPLAWLADTITRERSGLSIFVLDASRLLPDGSTDATLEALRRNVIVPLAGARLGQLRVVAGRGMSQLALLGAVAATAPRAWRVFSSMDLALSEDNGRLSVSAEELLGALNSELTPLGIVSQVRAQLGLNLSASVEEVALQLRTSPRSLQRAMSEAATTFANERLEVRLELAADRLSGTRDKVATIAAECGYRSIAHFIYKFRQRYGMSPREFRLRRTRGAELRG
jgi:AraC-like DNA-binding protein